MIFSGILHKNIVGYLEARAKFCVRGRELFGDENMSLYRSMHQIYFEQLVYLKKPMTTTEALKKKLVNLRQTPQAGLKFVGNGFACIAAIDDILHFLETGQPLFPEKYEEIPGLLAEVKAKALEENKKKLHAWQRERIEKEQKEMEEDDLEAQNERLLDVGLDPKKVEPFLARDPKREAGPTD